jgi:signal transduction histidine kinase
VDLAAYRIVQEALTNVMKHAGTGSSASVVLTYRGNALDLRISDDSAAVTSAGDGNGINGMRERVRLLGEAFSAGPRTGRGFEVSATLPIGGGHA